MTLLKIIMGGYGAILTFLFILTVGDFFCIAGNLYYRFNKLLKRVYVIILWPFVIFSSKGRSELAKIFIGD